MQSRVVRLVLIILAAAELVAQWTAPPAPTAGVSVAIIPFLIPALISAGGAAVSGIAQSRAQSKAQELDTQTARDLQDQRIASEESMADPFRQQLAQAGAMGRLDFMENASYAPVKVSAGPAASRYAGYQPSVSGGFSWEGLSPEVRAGAGALKSSVMAGRTAPTMTDPANYGATAAMDLYGVQEGAIDPRTGRPYTAQPQGGRGRAVPRRTPRSHDRLRASYAA